MNRTILFTPVGGTDPISSTNGHDGSMLHICRQYKPDEVVLYMSKEMLDFQEQDNRYLYCLQRLAKLQNRHMDYKIIERRELTKVHEFDYFYNDFRTIIMDIYKNMDETDRLLLNISSGTPAMKSGLLVLQTIGEYPATLVQVTTPEQAINEHVHKDYDVKFLWNYDEDNREDFQNRCKEISCPSLSKMKQEDIIKHHVKAYDYQAAIDVAEELPEEDTEAYYDMLYIGAKRLMLDFSSIDKVMKNKPKKVFPVTASADRKYFEYALNLDVKLKKEEYVDFVRGITPIVLDLFEMVLKKQCDFDVEQYSNRKGKNKVRRWNMNKMRDTKYLTILNDYAQERFHTPFKAGEVYSGHLMTLITGLSCDMHVVKLVQDIRDVEENVRNLAAHQIITITEDKIKELTGFSSKKIMDMLKELFAYTGISIHKEYWNAYDDMNDWILQAMDKND